MIGTNSLKLNLNFAFHWATDSEELLLVDGLEYDFLLNLVFVFITTNPSRSGSKYWRLISVLFFNNIVRSARVQNLELLRSWSGWLLAVSYLIEVVVNDFAEIYKHVLLDLNFRRLIDLDSRGVNDSKITNEVPSILANNHELRFPKLFVVRNLIVVSVSLSDFKNSEIAIEWYLKVLDLFSVNSLEI